MTEQIDLSKLSITELKAMVYDIAAQVQEGQKNVQIINQEIAKRAESVSKSETPQA